MVCANCRLRPKPQTWDSACRIMSGPILFFFRKVQKQAQTPNPKFLNSARYCVNSTDSCTSTDSKVPVPIRFTGIVSGKARSLLLSPPERSETIKFSRILRTHRFRRFRRFRAKIPSAGQVSATFFKNSSLCSQGRKNCLDKRSQYNTGKLRARSNFVLFVCLILTLMF